MEAVKKAEGLAKEREPPREAFPADVKYI